MVEPNKAAALRGANTASELSVRRVTLVCKNHLDVGFTESAAKMTDVPGHTRVIIPLLAQAGVKFLHIGVNHMSGVCACP
jgi:hypothetical protein